jgi:hypothetical protein
MKKKTDKTPLSVLATLQGHGYPTNKQKSVLTTLMSSHQPSIIKYISIWCK